MSESQKGTSMLKIITGSSIGVILVVGILLLCCICCCVMAIAIPAARFDTSSFKSITPDFLQDTLLGDTNNDSSETTEKIYKIGDVISYNNLNITVVEASDYISENEFFTPSEGNKFFTIDILIENVSAGPAGYGNPFNFTLKDGSGYSYTHSFFGKDPSIKSDSIAQGEYSRGFLTFEIPVISTGLVLIYNDSFFSTNDLKISLE